MRDASGKRDRTFADEAEQGHGLFENGFSASADVFKRCRRLAGGRHRLVGLVDDVLRHDFQQLGEFRTQVADLHRGTFVVQQPQEFLQDPSASSIEGLDARTVDDHL